MHILCIALRYNKPNKLQNHKSILYFNKTRVSVLFLRFPYFELRNIYKRFRIRVRIPISIYMYSSGFVRRYWSGPCTIYVVRFSHIVFNIGNKRFIIARLTMRCSYNELFTCVKRWLTNRIHGKVAEHSYVIAEITA